MRNGCLIPRHSDLSCLASQFMWSGKRKKTLYSYVKITSNTFFGLYIGESLASIKQQWDGKLVLCAHLQRLILQYQCFSFNLIFQRNNHKWGLFCICITHTVFQAVLVHILWCAMNILLDDRSFIRCLSSKLFQLLDHIFIQLLRL